MQHILSLLPAVHCQGVITRAESLFTWRDNALCNWLMLGERGLALLTQCCRLLLGLLYHHIIDERRCHLMGVGHIIFCGPVEHGDTVWTPSESELSPEICQLLWSFPARAQQRQTPKDDKANHYLSEEKRSSGDWTPKWQRQVVFSGFMHLEIPEVK